MVYYLHMNIVLFIKQLFQNAKTEEDILVDAFWDNYAANTKQMLKGAN